MTGQDLYQIQRHCSRVFGEQLPEWEYLSAAQQQEWDERAYEQELRDRVRAQ